MTDHDVRRPLDEWLREAYAGSCPPPEAFLEEERAALSPEERRRLDEHADGCPACAAERDLARSFDAGPAGLAEEDVDFVVGRLEEASPVRPRTGGRVVPFRAPRKREEKPGPSRTSASPLWKVAAAAMLVIASGLFFQIVRPGGGPPALPQPRSEGVFRGGEVELVSPVGEVAALPEEFRWTPVQGAASYRVRLLAVDDEVLWETTVPAPPARLPAEAAAGLHRAVSYTWTIEALGPVGERLAVSEPARFRARPSQ